MASYNSFSRWIHNLYGRDATMYFQLHNKNILEMDTLIVHDKGKGTGTKIINSVIEYAKKNKWVLSMTPSDEFGSNLTSLINFYKRFGFVDNTGSNFVPKAQGTMVLDLSK